MSRHSRRGITMSETIFRPSAYSTGIVPVQPYTPMWPEGETYGSAWSFIGNVIEYRRYILVGLGITGVAGVLTLRHFGRKKTQGKG